MTDPELRSLLLRRLPAEESARLEEAILLEDGFAERLCNEEFDLLDDYAAARLSAPDAGDVERYLLTSDHSRQSLRVARALQRARISQRAPAGPRRRRAAPVWGLAALLAACLALVVYVPQWHSGGGSGTVPTLSLTTDVARGGSQPPLAIPGAGEIRLQAEVPDPVPGTRYALIIEDLDGRELFAAALLEVRTAGRYRFVETRVPADALGPGERTVLLTGPGAAANAAAQFTWRITTIVQ